jgi:hypothetical protein
MANGGGPFGITNQYAADAVTGFLGDSILRDYTHASRTFTTNSYELKPRFKFLFHVSFTINYQEIPYLRGVFSNDEISNLSLLVKTVDLPKYNVQTHTLNQYNRKRVVQTKVDYQPVTLTFHDDGGDNSRKLWYYYFSYYYADPNQQYLGVNNTNGSLGASLNRQAGFGYNNRDIYNDVMQIKDWGYSGEKWGDGTNLQSGKPPFFRDIRIYGLDQRKFAEYVLINPVISNWSHDQYDYSQGAGTMQHSMTINYETVKYYEGAVGRSRPDTNVEGFADPTHYDTRLSPIARPGANQTVLGQGGLLDAGLGIISDLQSGSLLGLIGAAQTAGRTYETFKGANLKSTVTSEATALGFNTLIQALPGGIRQLSNATGGVFIPTPATPGNPYYGVAPVVRTNR